MKILITGGYGFVGKHLVAYLRANTDHELLVPLKYDGSNECWKRANALNTFCMNPLSFTNIDVAVSNIKPDVIIHLAGVVGGIGFNIGNQGKLLNDNLLMGMNILNVAKHNNVRKVIMMGTTCSYPCTPRTIPFIEDELFDGMPEITNSGYGIAKRTLVKMGIEYSKQYGMNIVNLIPTNMVGEHDHFEANKSHVIPALINKFEQSRLNQKLSLTDEDGHEYDTFVTLWGTGSASRDFLYAGDCARAIAIAIEKDVSPEPINLGCGQEITIKSLAEMIKRIGNYNSDIVWDSTKPDGQPRRALDISRAKEVLKWEPQVSVEEAIRRTINWYRNQA